jgi:hypothetical protein
MASAGALTIDLNANTARLRSDFTKAAAITKQYQRQSISVFKKVSGAVTSLKGAMFALAGVGGIGALAHSFVNAASTSEQYAVRLKVLLGSVSEGNALFKDMAVFASKVPFEYENIMNSATQLAGVMKGGVKEINQWMPLIGDLAATSGMSIEETTGQVVRMYSAGAASADMFREKGILSMLGFKAGVSYTAEETRQQLMDSWTKQGSQFRGATEELARTWDGGMSMLSDKWFAFRNTVMEGGLFDWLKGLVAVINGELGAAMANNGKIAKGWSQTIINALEGAIRGFAFFSDTITGIRLLFKTLEVAAWGFATVVNTIADTVLTPIIQGWIKIGRLLGLQVGNFTALTTMSEGAAAGLKQATTELSNLVDSMTAQTNAEKFLANLRAEAEGIASAAGQPLASSGGGTSTTGGADVMEQEFRDAILLQDRLDELYAERDAARTEAEKERAKLWNDLWVSTANNVAQGIGDAFADAIIEQKSMAEALKSLMTSVIKSVISGLVQIAIKRTLLNAMSQAEEKAIVVRGIVSAGILATAYAPAAAAASLASFGANAAPAMEGISATHALSQSLALAGQAHDGMDYVPREGSYNLQRGEMVLDPGTSAAVRNNAVGGGAKSVTLQISSPNPKDTIEHLKRNRAQLGNIIKDWMNEEGHSFA